MNELTQAQTCNAWPLFHDITHSRSFVCSLFEGNHLGRIFVDRVDRPAVAVLDLMCEFMFICGDTTNATFNAELQSLLQSRLQGGKYLFLVTFDDAWRALLTGMLEGSKILSITRSVYSINAERFAPQANWRARVPEGFRIQRYDRALTESAIGIAEFWGSIDRFLSHGLGYAVLKGDEVVSRCHTVLAGDRRMEISIETAEAYRRQGFATLAACAFIEHCLNERLHPDWSCWTANTASGLLAEKIGFQREANVPVIFVSPPQ